MKKKNNKQYIRKIEGMGEGLVLFEISVDSRRIGQNYHLFYEDKRKPPLDIAINPDDGTIEYISYFAQDEKIENIKNPPRITSGSMRIGKYDNNFNEDNISITVERNFKIWKMGNEILILKEGLEESVIKAYKIDDLNNLLFVSDDLVGVELKNLNREEIQKLQNSKCLS